MTIGSESFRYLQGQAIAVNHENEQSVVDLNDIFTLAEKLSDVKNVDLM